MIWFTSDQHFSHANIVKYCGRPFEDVHAMNKAMTDRWNAVVAPDDEVYVLGDVCFNFMSIVGIYNALNGRKHLIKGNHDKGHDSVFNQIFETIQTYKSLDYTDPITDQYYQIVMSHYPLEVWEHKNRGAIHLFGHVHNNADWINLNHNIPNRYNVGVDINDFTPVSIDQIIEWSRQHED